MGAQSWAAAHGAGGGAVAMQASLLGLRSRHASLVEAVVPISAMLGFVSDFFAGCCEVITDGEGRGCEEKPFKQACSPSKL